MPRGKLQLNITWTPEMVSAAGAFRQQGMAIHIIAERLGVSDGAFRRWREKNGISLSRIRDRGRAPATFTSEKDNIT